MSEQKKQLFAHIEGYSEQFYGADVVGSKKAKPSKPKKQSIYPGVLLAVACVICGVAIGQVNWKQLIEASRQAFVPQPQADSGQLISELRQVKSELDALNNKLDVVFAQNKQIRAEYEAVSEKLRQSGNSELSEKLGMLYEQTRSYQEQQVDRLEEQKQSIYRIQDTLKASK